jgi:hypothetical protein
VIPEECQSIPITAPNAWNQNGSPSRVKKVMNDRLCNRGAEFCHTLGKPQRNTTAM